VYQAAQTFPIQAKPLADCILAEISFLEPSGDFGAYFQ
jgi:hypothetical protein